MIKGKCATRLPDGKNVTETPHRPLLREGGVKGRSIKPTAEPPEALCFHQKPWKRVKWARTNNSVSPKQKWQQGDQQMEQRVQQTLPTQDQTMDFWYVWERNIQTSWGREAAQDREKLKASTRTLPEIRHLAREADGKAWIATTHGKGW